MRCMGCMKEFSSDGSICPHCGYDQNTPTTHSNHLKPGTMVAGRYLIGKALGSGGFGVTYIAFDHKLNRRVALKEFLPNYLAEREGKNIVPKPGSNSNSQPRNPEDFGASCMFSGTFRRISSVAGFSRFSKGLSKGLSYKQKGGS